MFKHRKTKSDELLPDTLGTPAGSKKKKFDLKHCIPVWLMMLPGVAYLFVNNILPLYGLTIAFRDLDYSLGILNSPFNGLDNFEILFKNPSIWKLLRNTIGYNVLFIVLDVLIPVTVAILFNTIRSKTAKKVYQTAILFPYVLSYVIISYIAYAFLSTETGFINQSILQPLFGTTVSFYTEPKYWPFILTIVHIWKSVGFGLVFYLSALSGIDTNLYEAAKIDGANWWQSTRWITLPGMKTMIITMFIMSLAGIVRSDFGLFYQVTKNIGDLYPATQTLDVYVYNTLMNSVDITSSSAVSAFQSLVGFVMIVGANAIVKKIDPERAIF